MLDQCWDALLPVGARCGPCPFGTGGLMITSLPLLLCGRSSVCSALRVALSLTACRFWGLNAVVIILIGLGFHFKRLL